MAFVNGGESKKQKIVEGFGGLPLLLLFTVLGLFGIYMLARWFGVDALTFLDKNTTVRHGLAVDLSKKVIN